MKEIVVSRMHTSRMQVLMVALVLVLLLALMLPQLSWADHASDHPESQFDSLPSILSSEAYAALVAKYETGRLVYNAPGRRDDSLLSILPSEAYASLVAKYETGRLVYNAPGRRDDSPSIGSANSEQMGATFVAANPEMAAYRRYAAGLVQQADTGFLAANPETMTSQHYATSQQALAAAADSARWVALGEYYANMGATFLAANPEVVISRSYIDQNGCSGLGLAC